MHLQRIFLYPVKKYFRNRVLRKRFNVGEKIFTEMRFQKVIEARGKYLSEVFYSTSKRWYRVML